MFSIPVTPVYMAEQDRTRSAEAVIRHPSNESRARLSHCGTLQKCFAPKILGKAACWHVAPYGHIMTYYGEKNSKKANL